LDKNINSREKAPLLKGAVAERDWGFLDNWEVKKNYWAERNIYVFKN